MSKTATILKRPEQRQTRRRRGFTLIETALATIIVGVGIVASMSLFAACSQQNRASARMSVAMMLANNVQEVLGGLTFADPGLSTTYFGPEPGETLPTFDDIDDFDGIADSGLTGLNPPIDSLRQRITDMPQYTQVISVWPVYPSKLNVNNNPTSPDVSKSTYTGALRVNVSILYAATTNDTPTEVYRASWVRLDN
jgi:prepilin-type N-terminal cleavage/methylation domain-containing protein